MSVSVARAIYPIHLFIYISKKSIKSAFPPSRQQTIKSSLKSMVELKKSFTFLKSSVLTEINIKIKMIK